MSNKNDKIILIDVCTHGVSDDHVREGVIPAEIQADFHAGVSASDDEHSLSAKLVAGPVSGGVNDLAGKSIEAGDFGAEGVGVFSGGGDEPAGDEAVVGSDDGPESGGGVEGGGEDGLAEDRADVEVVGVGFDVGDELAFGGVFWEMAREWEVWEVAEVLWEVKFESVVASLFP